MLVLSLQPASDRIRRRVHGEVDDPNALGNLLSYAHSAINKHQPMAGREREVLPINDELTCATNLISLSQPDNPKRESLTPNGQFPERQVERYVMSCCSLNLRK